MSFKSTIFSQILQLVNRDNFKNQVSRYDADKKTSALGCYQILVIMIFSQLKNLKSLRDIETNFNLIRDHFYHLNLKSVKRSSLSDALKVRDYKVFEDYYFYLLDKLNHKQRKKFEKKLNILDSTTVGLCLSKYEWAKYKTTKSGVKIHTLLDYDLKVPVDIIITNAGKHDMVPVRNLEFKKGEIYTFDRAYNDFSFWYKADSNGAVFVTRLKTNVCYEVITKRESNEKKGIVSDELIILTGTKSENYPKTLRIIKFYDEKKDETMTFVTNDLTSESEVITDIYKSRWEIELFFKWVKQHLEIKKYISTSENGVMIQIWTALITYLLLAILKQSRRLKESIFEILRRIIPSLLKRIDLLEILTMDFRKNIPKRRSKNSQLVLKF